MKKLYKLVIAIDTEQDDCEILTETLDEYNTNSEIEILNLEDFVDKELRNELIKIQIMGDA